MVAFFISPEVEHPLAGYGEVLLMSANQVRLGGERW